MPPTPNTEERYRTTPLVQRARRISQPTASTCGLVGLRHQSQPRRAIRPAKGNTGLGIHSATQLAIFHPASLQETFETLSKSAVGPFHAADLHSVPGVIAPLRQVQI